MTKEDFLSQFVITNARGYLSVETAVEAATTAWDLIQKDCDTIKPLKHHIFFKNVEDVIQTSHVSTLSYYVRTVEELVKSNKYRISRLRNIGHKTLSAIDDFLDKNGLWYGMDDIDIESYSKTHRA